MWRQHKMTKQKISITLDEEMLEIIETILKDAQFRNRSHVIEYSLKRFLNEMQLKKQFQQLKPKLQA